MAVIIALPMICSVVSDQGIMNAGLRHCCINLFLCVARSPSPPFGFLRIFDHVLWSQRRVVNNSNVNVHAHAHEGPCRHHAVFALLSLNAALMRCWWEASSASILRCSSAIRRLLSAMTRPCTVICRCSSACMRTAACWNNS